MLVNMFDHATETEKDFHVDIQEDVKEECESKFGRVIQCIADKTNANGLVFLQFDSIESSAKVSAVISACCAPCCAPHCAPCFAP